jgi:hypothetical protein
MPRPAVIRAFDSSLDNATGLKTESTGGGTSLLTYLVGAGGLLPDWWSKRRDLELGKFWKKANHLSIAVYNAQSKLVGIPFTIVPKDPTNIQHTDEALELTELMIMSSEFAKSWGVGYAKFVEDLLTQDNGAFMEIIGDGLPNGPIIGRPTSVRHLDSFRCTRTSDPRFPVTYMGQDDKRYKLHWTRVIYMSQMPSARAEMNEVGVCAVSRAIDIAQNLLDITYYKQQRLGSRPPNMMLIGKGVTGKQIMDAMFAGEEAADNTGRSIYSKTVAIGSENPDIDVKRLDLTHMEPFDEQTSTTLGMYAIASAFGMDAQELWPTNQGSSNQADSSLRRMRSRGKLPAQTTADLEVQFDMKVLPAHLKLKFDFRDDEEDQQRALIRDIRGRNRVRDISSATIDVRGARQLMLDDGDIDRTSFEMMEANDGRLPDGTNIGVLFFANDPVFKKHLSIRGMDILQTRANEPLSAISKIQSKRSGLLKAWAATSSTKKRKQFMFALSALDWIESQYDDILEPPEEDPKEPPRDGRDDG